MICRHIAGSRRAFTLIELMIVMVIIGLMVALGGFAYMNQLEKTKRKAARSAVKGNLRLALGAFYLDNNFYPTTEQGLQSLTKKPGLGPQPQNWTKPYFDDKDALIDPWGRPYQYASPGNEDREYDLWSHGKNPEATEDDIRNW